MSYCVLSVIEYRNTLIHSRKHFCDRNIFNTNAFEDICIGHHFLEAETASESSINGCNRTVSGIHSANDIYIIGYAEQLLRVWQLRFHAFRLTDTLGSFNQGDQLTKDFADIATIDLINNENTIPLFFHLNRSRQVLLDQSHRISKRNFHFVNGR